MTRDEKRLVHHLVIAVVVKLALLATLWWLFVHDTRVDTNAERTASHIGMTGSAQGATR